MFQEQHWYSAMAKTHVYTLFSSHWALTNVTPNVRYTLAMHVRLSLGLRGKTRFPEWGKTGL